MSAISQQDQTSMRIGNPANYQVGMRWLALGALLVSLVAVFLLILLLGSVNIPLSEVLTVLLGGEASREAWTNIILKFRLPKAITATLAGAALGVGGLMMQTLFRNPLAGPFILGISSGASLGVALVVLASGSVAGVFLTSFDLTGDFVLVLAACLGSAVALLLVIVVARRVRSVTGILILGLMFGYFTSAVVSLLLYFSAAEQVQAYINWTFGTFSTTTWRQLQIVIPVVLGTLGFTMLLPKALNALQLGEAYAETLGVHIQRVRLGIILLTAILTGVITAFCGPIGFIGIAVPHLTRNTLRTTDQRTLVPATMILGAIVALLAALIAELPGSQAVLPINAVTALLGAPIVIVVVLRQRNLRLPQ